MIADIAREVLDGWGTGRQIASLSNRYPGFCVADAYRVTAEVRRRREASGANAIGRKIGFTNRTIWAELPMWGYVYDQTVHDLSRGVGNVSLSGLAEPRIEPEIVFGLGATPAPGMSTHDLVGCIDWVAHGFEVVQSIFLGWAFSGADAIAGYGLHGMLLIGDRHRFGGSDDDWERRLAGFEIDLSRDGTVVDHGCAANVMGGPVLALAHLVDLLANDTVNPPLAAREIVTTGTLTGALPIAAGDVWSTTLTGISLAGLQIRVR